MTSIQIAVTYALSFLGVHYRWAGDDPMAGYDCSGLVQEILASVGLDPAGDQSAQMLYDYFKPVAQSAIGQGALVFYGKDVKSINHVAFMVGNRSVIEAGGGGSTTVNLEAAIKQNAFIRIRPVDHRKDRVAVLMPRYPA